MRATVTIDEDLFGEADSVAQQLGLSRSALYQRALTDYLQRLRDRERTERTNRHLEEFGESIDDGYESYVAEVWSRDMGSDEW